MFKKVLIFAVVVCFMMAFTSSVNAATLELQPATGTANVGDTISVNLVLNVAAGENVWGYEAYILYPTNLLTYNASQFIAGSVFATGGKTIQSSSGDKVAVGGYFDSSSMGTTTGGVVATLRFSAGSSGSAVVSIICDQFTNVYSISPNSTNLFTNCVTLAPKSTFTIAGAGGATSTPTGTLTPTPTGTLTPTPTTHSSGTSLTSTPTPAGGLTTLPATGALENVLRLIFLGGGMLVIGGLFIFGFTRTVSRKLR